MRNKKIIIIVDSIIVAIVLLGLGTYFIKNKFDNKVSGVNSSEETLVDNSAIDEEAINNEDIANEDEKEDPVIIGISFDDFSNRLVGMGFGSDGFYYENGISMGGVAVKGSLVSFALENNSPQFNSVIKNCFNLLLPTQGDRLYNIVLNPFSNQTLTMDGRTVEIK